MCIADIAFARRTYVKTTSVPLGTVVTIPANPDRLSISLYCNAVGTAFYTISLDPDSALVDTGLLVYERAFANVNDIMYVADATLDYRKHNAIVQQRLFVKANNGNGTVVEVIMNPDLAREVKQYLDSERAKYGRK